MRSARQMLAASLAVGLLATPVIAQDGATNPDLLPGVDLVTEEVEPGVYRVLNDGVRDLERVADEPDVYMGGLMSNVIAAGRDGSVWILWPDGFFRVGDPRTHSWGHAPRPLIDDDVEVSPDGTLWRLSGGSSSHALMSFDGDAWTTRSDRAVAYDMLPDGTVWVMADEPDAYERLGTDGSSTRFDCAEQGPEGCWRVPDAQDDPDYEDFVVQGAVTDFAVLPVVHRWLLEENPGPTAYGLLAYMDPEMTGQGGELVWWLLGEDRQTEGYDSGLMGGIRLLDMDEDGGYWAYQHFDVPVAGMSRENEGQPSERTHYLVHSDGRTQHVYAGSDGVPDLRGFYHKWLQGFAGFLRAAPDGTVWMSVNAETGSITECDGLVDFDGTTWHHHLDGSCIYALDVAPDGKVWLQAGTRRTDERSGRLATYVITPEAVAAAE